MRDSYGKRNSLKTPKARAPASEEAEAFPRGKRVFFKQRLTSTHFVKAERKSLLGYVVFYINCDVKEQQDLPKEPTRKCITFIHGGSTE
ncbi:hypothetical protein GCM10027286_08710 [Virgibacillus ainsalahensis]